MTRLSLIDTSYEVTDEGALKVVSGAVPTTETAACWLVVTDDDRFAYTANAGGGSISGFRVDNDDASGCSPRAVGRP
jgi:hypothetical protein